LPVFGAIAEVCDIVTAIGVTNDPWPAEFRDKIG
jgi:hypothetical protein